MSLVDVFREIAPEIKRIMEKRRGILAVYLFGSVACGKEGPLSDIDIAILYDKGREYTPSIFKDELLIGYEIEKLLRGKDIRGHEVEVVNLNRSNLLLKYKVIKEGKRIYVRDKRGVVLFEADVISKYCDFKPTLDFINRFYIDGKLRKVGIR